VRADFARQNEIGRRLVRAGASDLPPPMAFDADDSADAAHNVIILLLLLILQSYNNMRVCRKKHKKKNSESKKNSITRVLQKWARGKTPDGTQ